ncbi:MAG: protein kinase [Gemmatimonadaceae bacterium]
MTIQIRDQLQATLGTAYTLERELGGGGMSRVFIAVEGSLGRRVVVKVLSPDLSAGVSLDRFRREIQVAAQLQHPHIIPVLTTGETNGLPFYTMPFVEGESLRTQLARRGELSVTETVRILRDVLEALAYAHRHNVVHRDIKPENILVADNAALVTDFGVAKALSVAAVNGPLTSVGLVLGTTAYMSPEQAVGDPAVDHRADLYSVGVLAYELLTGQPPFAGRSLQAVLAAHATEIPELITARRPSVPPVLASIVMRLLEKRPADRPQSAEEVLAQLDTASRPDTGRTSAQAPRHVSRRTLTSGLAVLLVMVAVAALIANGRRPLRAGNLDPNLVAIAPFRTSGAHRSLEYLGEGMVDLLAAKLTGEGGARAADPRSVLSAWRRAAGKDGIDIPQPAALRLAGGLGAGQLLLGGVIGTPDHVTLNASVLQVPAGKTRAEATVQGSPDSLPWLVDQLVGQLLARQSGETGHRLDKLTSTSLPALRAYLDGKQAYRNGRYTDAAGHFARALELDSTFTLAALGLASASNWTSDWQTGDRALDLAWATRDRLSDADRAYLIASAGTNYPELPTRSEQVALWEEAARVAPDRAETWFHLGDLLLHFGPYYGLEDAHERAVAALDRSIALDSSFAAAIEHRLELSALAGAEARIRALASMYFTNDSTADVADYMRWRVAYGMADSTDVATLRSRIDRMNGLSLVRIIGMAQRSGIGLEDAERAAKANLARATTAAERETAHLLTGQLFMNRGRFTEAWSHFLRAQPAGHPNSLIARVQDALYYGGDTVLAAKAANRLERLAVSSTGRDGLATQYNGTCWLAKWNLARGDVSTVPAAIARLRILAKTRAEEPRRHPLPPGQPALCVLLLEAELAVLKRSNAAAAAVGRIDSTLRTGPIGPHTEIANIEVARLYATLKDYRSALLAIQRQEYNWDLNSLWYFSTFLREEGKLAELAGEREAAIRAYRHYLRLRTRPEPLAEAEVARVRVELEVLERQQGSPQ